MPKSRHWAFRGRHVIAFSMPWLLYPRFAFATWVPLIDATDFDGMRADMLTTAGGIVSVTLIIVGLAYLARSMTR